MKSRSFELGLEVLDFRHVVEGDTGVRHGCGPHTTGWEACFDPEERRARLLLHDPEGRAWTLCLHALCGAPDLDR